ncbi:MAG: winged helix-turn-helix transcriptional regulator, partial [Alkalispirochaeta sp.]
MFYASDPDADFNGTADELASRSSDAPDATDAPDTPDAQATPDERELQVLTHVHQVVDQRRARATASGSSSGTATDTGTSTDAHESSADTPDQATATGHLSQRSIARALGMSVGLTNAILKRLPDKGFLMMRRINAHNVHYLPGHNPPGCCSAMQPGLVIRFAHIRCVPTGTQR